MSFKNIYVGQTVKKIVLMIRTASYPASPVLASYIAVGIAERIERGDWKDIKLPRPEKPKKAEKKK